MIRRWPHSLGGFPTLAPLPTADSHAHGRARAKYLDANVDDSFVSVIAHEYIHPSRHRSALSSESVPSSWQSWSRAASRAWRFATTEGREREIEDRFAAYVDKMDLSDWVDDTTDRVGQLGYWVVYRIAFFQHARDQIAQPSAIGAVGQDSAMQAGQFAYQPRRLVLCCASV